VGDVAFAADLMVINVSPTRIRQRRAVVSPYAFYPIPSFPTPALKDPLYWKWEDETHTTKVMNPYAQIDPSDAVPPIDPDTGKMNYNPNGF